MVGKALVRVIGCLHPGFLKVEHVPQPKPPNVVVINDSAWIDQVPLALVPEDLRIANAEFVVLVKDRMQVIGVERLGTAELGAGVP